MPDLFTKPETHIQNPVQPPPSHPVAQPVKQTAKPQPNPKLYENHIHFLASFCQNPSGLHFQNEEVGDQIVLFIRSHFIKNLRWILTVAVFSALPLLIPILFAFVPIPDFPGNYLLIGTLFYYLVVLGYGFIQFITWYYNVGIITKEHVVDIDYSHITYKNVASTTIEGIVDIEYTQGGFLNTLFDFGDIHVQTEGIKATIEYYAVPHPGRVVDIILDLKGGKKHSD